MSAQEASGWRSWTTEAEQALLREYARNRVVLEVGAYEGASTAALADAAVVVHTVDTFAAFADDPDGQANLERFRAHMEGRRNVVIHVGRSDQVLPRLAPGFDLAFVDGSHEYGDARFDIEACLELVAAGDGYLAVHDCGYQPVADAIRDAGLDQTRAVAEADQGRLKVWRT